MKINDKIFLAGHLGLVGSSIHRLLKKRGFRNILVQERKELDLIRQSDVESFFKKEKPDYVILAAAKVGGILANNKYPADFIYENLMIESNIISSSFENNVKRLLFLGSTCIYPKLNSQPMKEDSLLDGKLESSNEPYAIAKIAGIKLCESYNRQKGTDFRSIMPTNLYGTNDDFLSEDSHVIPGLIRRFHEAKINKDSEVIVWGSGKARRDFLYVDDMAEASIFILELQKKIYESHTKPMSSHINIGTGRDISIKELANLIKKVVGFKGKIIFDNSKLEGTPKKLTDISLLSEIGWFHKVKLKAGLEKTYSWYVSNYDNDSG